MKSEFTAGESIEIDYPFYRPCEEIITEFAIHDRSWRIGAEPVQCAPDGQWYHFADGIGRKAMTIVSIHKPAPRYPARIFYTTEWTDPDGVKFTSGRLRVSTIGKFRKLFNGYFEDFEMRERDV